MTVETISQDEDGHSYAGLSGDTKPTATMVPVGSWFWEYDTQLLYRVAGGAWRVSPAQSVNLVLQQDASRLGNDYDEFVGASATSQAFGATGAAGDWLSHIQIIPLTVSPGAVSLQDGSDTDRTIFAGGATSVVDLKSFTYLVGKFSQFGAWKLTTGTNVTAIMYGAAT